MIELVGSGVQKSRKSPFTFPNNWIKCSSCAAITPSFYGTITLNSPNAPTNTPITVWLDGAFVYTIDVPVDMQTIVEKGSTSNF